LQVQDARATLADAASDSRLVLEKLDFTGELRSLVGPVKGDGSFVIAGQRYPYRIASSRIGADAGTKLRFMIDPIDQPLAADADLRLGRQPEFSGTLSSPQIDLDRVLALPETRRRRPLAAVKTFAESLLEASRLPIPAALNLNAESVTLGGATLVRLAAEVKA